MNLKAYRESPPAKRTLAAWRLLSEADRAEYMEAGGASAPINNPPIAEEANTVDPAVAATIERIAANYKLATTAAPRDAVTAAALERIAANYKAASGFDLRRREG
jgi:hypothetical protein